MYNPVSEPVPSCALPLIPQSRGGSHTVPMRPVGDEWLKSRMGILGTHLTRLATTFFGSVGCHCERGNEMHVGD